MNRLLLILILTLSFQSSTQADDIKDFEIEGMSIGDSALDFFTESKLNNKESTNYYKDDDFIGVTIYLEDSIYDSIGLTLKPGDKKYLVYGINGGIHIDNNKECLIKKDNIVKEISEMFKNAEVVNPGKRDYAADPTGESKSYSIYYWMEGAFIEISCYDLTEKLAKKENWRKNILNVNVTSKEFSDFLLTKEYVQ